MCLGARGVPGYTGCSRRYVACSARTSHPFGLQSARTMYNAPRCTKECAQGGGYGRARPWRASRD